MMDNNLVICESTDISGGTYTSLTQVGDTLYFPQDKDHKGNSVNPRLNVNGRSCLNIVVEDAALARAGVTTVTFSLYEHTSATTPVSSGTELCEFVISAVDLTSGTAYPDGTKVCTLPLPIKQCKPYIALGVITDSALTTGKISAWLGPAHQEGT